MSFFLIFIINDVEIGVNYVFRPAKRKSGGIMAHQNIRAMMPPDAGRTKTFISL